MYTEEKRESDVALTQKKQDDTLLNIGFLSYVEKSLDDFILREYRLDNICYGYVYCR